MNEAQLAELREEIRGELAVEFAARQQETVELTERIREEEREKLLKSRIEIARAEKANLISIAAAYDKMDATKASEILTNMSKMQDSSDGNGFDDAVKILYCMTERTKAKLLAELTTSEPKLAAVFCQRLKQIIERA